MNTVLPESSRYASDDMIEIVVSEREEHILQLIGDLEGEVLWVNDTQKGILPGDFDILKQHYKEIEALHLLDVLVKKGLLKRIDNGIVLLCPSCNSHNASILLSCPSCSSHELRRKQKIVHKKCGHWGVSDEFISDGALKCPNCEARATLDDLKGGEEFSYSDPYYECSKCRFTTNRGMYLHLCKSCGERFNISKAVQIEQTGYKLTADPVAELYNKQQTIEPKSEPPQIKQELIQESEPVVNEDPVLEPKKIQKPGLDIPLEKGKVVPDQTGEPVEKIPVKEPEHKKEPLRGVEMEPTSSTDAMDALEKEEVIEENEKSMKEFFADYLKRIEEVTQVIEPVAKEPPKEETEIDSLSDPSEKVVVKDEASLDLEKFELEKEIKGINHEDSFEFENNSQNFEPDNSSMRYELVVEERTRTNKIIEIKGIGPAYNAKLNELNIFTVSDLLDRGTSPEGRKKIAKDANISPRLIIDWVNQADLLEETQAEPEELEVKLVVEEVQAEPEELGVKLEVEEAQDEPEELEVEFEFEKEIKEMIPEEPEPEVETSLDLEEFVVEEAQAEPEELGVKLEVEEAQAEPEELEVKLEVEEAQAEPEELEVKLEVEEAQAEPEELEVKLVVEEAQAEPEELEVKLVVEEAQAEPEEPELKKKASLDLEEFVVEEAQAEPEELEVKLVVEEVQAEPEEPEPEVETSLDLEEFVVEEAQAEPEELEVEFEFEKGLVEPEEPEPEVETSLDLEEFVVEEAQAEPEELEVEFEFEKGLVEPEEELEVEFEFEKEIKEMIPEEPEPEVETSLDLEEFVVEEAQAEPEELEVEFEFEKGLVEPEEPEPEVETSLDLEEFVVEEAQAEPEELEVEFEFEKGLVEPEEPEPEVETSLDLEEFVVEEAQAEPEELEVKLVVEEVQAEPEELEVEFESEREIKAKIGILMDLLGEKIAQTKVEEEVSLELEKEEIKAKIFTLMDLLSEKLASENAKDEVCLDLEEFVVEEAQDEPEELEVEFEFEKEIKEMIPEEPEPEVETSLDLEEFVVEEAQAEPEEPEPKKEEEKPENETRKVLMIVEDQMLFNLIVESLEKVGAPIEITYVENGSQALKSLRILYDLIIMDSKLSKADPNFIIMEMEKWKVKTPLILLDNGRLRKIPKKLNTIAVLKRKQIDIRSITKHVTEIF